MTAKLIFEWSLLVLGIVALGYAMIVIKEEKKSFLENALTIKIGPFSFSIPSWWGATETTENFQKYERTDTRYEWFCEYHYYKDGKNNRSIEQHIGDVLEEKEIAFDQDGVVIANPVSFQKKVKMFEHHPEIKFARVEGTATQAGITRIYFDCFLLHPNEDENDDSYLLAFSWSSVLNGAVEGPYFEESLYSIR